MFQNRNKIYKTHLNDRSKHETIIHQSKEHARLKTKYHNILSRYFLSQSINLYSDQENFNIRKLVELPWQQINAGMAKEFKKTLQDFSFLNAKCSCIGIQALIADFLLFQLNSVIFSANDLQSFELMGKGCLISAHILTKYPNQLSSQLFGRLNLINNYGIKTFLDNMLNCQVKPWLMPMSNTLESPGGALIRKLDGHTGTITSVVLTNDNRFVISGSSDGTITIWDINSHSIIYNIKNNCSVTGLILGANDSILISAFDDGSIKIHNRLTCQPIHSFKDHTGSITSIAYNSHNNLLVSGSEDCTIKLYDLEKRKVVRNLSAHTKKVLSVAISEDGKLLASGSADNNLKIWDVNKGYEISTIKEFNSVYKCAINSDNKLALSICDGIINIWDIGEKKSIYHFGIPKSCEKTMDLSSDNLILVTGSWDFDSIKVWNTKSWEIMRHLEGHSSVVYSLNICSNLPFIVSGSADKSIILWDLNTGNIIRKYEGHNADVYAVAITPDSKYIVSGSLDGKIKVWDTASGNEIFTLTHKIFISENCRDISAEGKSILSIAISNDGQFFASGTAGSNVKLWELKTGIEVGDMNYHQHWVTTLRFSPNGRYIVSGSKDFAVKVWDLHCNEVFDLKGHTASVTSVDVTYDNRYVISGSSDTTIIIWDLNTKNEIFTLKGHIHSINTVTACSDSHLFYSCSDDYTIKKWDIDTRQEIKDFIQQDSFYDSRTSIQKFNEPMDVAVITDKYGDFIVSKSDISGITFWDPKTGQKVEAVYGQININSLIGLRYGSEIAISGIENVISLWSIIENNSIIQNQKHNGKVCAMTIDHVNKLLITGSDDETLKVWDITSKQLIRTIGGQNGDVRSISLDHSGDLVFVGSQPFDGKSLSLWNIHTGRKIQLLSYRSGHVSCLKISRDGHYLVTASGDNFIKVFDLNSNENLSSLIERTCLHENDIEAVNKNDKIFGLDISHDNKYLVTSSLDKITIWNLENKQSLKSIIHCTDIVRFTPNNRYLITNNWGANINIWDFTTGNHLFDLYGHTERIRSMDISQDGSLLVTGADDHSIRVWDLLKHEQLTFFIGESSFWSCVFSYDNKMIFAGDNNGKVFFLQLS